MDKLSNLLSEMSILTEANEDDLFDIDKEVDAQIKRVTKRIERKKQENLVSQEDQQDKEISNSEEEQSDNIVSDDVDDNTTDDTEESDDVDDIQNIDTNIDDTESQEQSDDYEYMDNSDSSDNNISDGYDVKQSIPELKILSTLSDSEYSLCNIKIIEQFRELQNNVESTINNILMNITTKNDRQVQVVEIVHQNLHEMIEDINTYILYRNNDIYEENVRTYLTYLKRYDIAMKLIKNILDENSKSKNDV